MRGWRGFAAGILGLSILYALTTEQGSKRVGGLWGDIANLTEKGMARLTNPSIAGLRDFNQAPLKPPAYKFRPAGGKSPPTTEATTSIRIQGQ